MVVAWEWFFMMLLPGMFVVLSFHYRNIRVIPNLGHNQNQFKKGQRT